MNIRKFCMLVFVKNSGFYQKYGHKGPISAHICPAMVHLFSPKICSLDIFYLSAGLQTVNTPKDREYSKG